MSTRSLTVFLNDKGQEFCILYKQHDGFPIFYGRFLSECLTDENIVGRATPEDLARSIPKLAANKYGQDEFTLYKRTTFNPHNWSDHLGGGIHEGFWVDYIYTISCYEDYDRKPMIQVHAVRKREGRKNLFTGFGEEFFKWILSLKVDEQCSIGFDDDEDKYDEEGNLIGLLA